MGSRAGVQGTATDASLNRARLGAIYKVRPHKGGRGVHHERTVAVSLTIKTPIFDQKCGHGGRGSEKWAILCGRTL